MQVPESFFHRSPSLEPNRKKDTTRVQPADDSFRKMMAEERRKIKETDVDAKRNSKDMGEVEESDDDQEFSIFGTPKKEARPAKNAVAVPQRAPKQPQTEDNVAELVNVPTEADVEAPPEEPEVISKQQFTPTVTDQQSKLDDVRQNNAPVFVEKKDKEDLQKAQAAYNARNKTSKQDAPRIIVPQSDGQEVVETPTEDIVHGKQLIKEQQSEPQKQIAMPGSKEGETHFKNVQDQQAAEMKKALGVQDPKEVNAKKELPKTTQEKSEKGNAPSEQPRADDNTPIDPRSVAFIPAGALPKEKGEIAVNSEQPVQKAPLATKLQEIVDQIVKEIYTLSDDGSSETTITLQHPPLFNGVKVVIETFKNAPNQLNITFVNLTGPGKRLLDENLASLKTAIEHNDRGMIVQQLSTTTLNEVPRYVADAQQNQKDRDQQDQQGSGKNNQPDDEDEEKKRKK
ncbi:MAG: hypothetical protein WC222_00205 [Parachlamydiales bacterium]|jgi:hypothetical protein